MANKEKDIEARIQALERFVRDIKIASGIIGACLVAFLGWQSYSGIPKAVDNALKSNAITLAKNQASQSLDEIKKCVEAASKAVDQLEKTKQKAQDIIAFLDKKSLSVEVDEIKKRLDKMNISLSSLQKKDESYEDLRKTVGRLEGKVSGRFLKVNNKCDEEIKIVVKYKMPYGEERTLGWWNVSPKDGQFLAEGDKRIVLNSNDVYFYAETTKEPKKFWKGSVAGEFNGVTLALMKAKVIENEDYYELPITCSN